MSTKKEEDTEKSMSTGSRQEESLDLDVSDASQKTFYDPSKESIWTRLGLSFESFKKAPGTTGSQTVHGDLSDTKKMLLQDSMLQQQMKPRHLNMIAVGGAIGTGLFVGSGSALHTGGPAGVLIAWLIIGVLMINVTQALAELSILYPVSGGFYTLSVRFLDPSFAFGMGWNYLLQLAVVLPLEITSAGITVDYWPKAATVPIAGWITVFWIALIIISLFGTLGYAEEEFWSSCLKLLVVVMFLLIGIVCICGGGPSSGFYNHYIGGTYWQNPGAFANGFKGLCAVFVTAAFSFAGTEVVGLAASETADPRSSMPGAVKGTFWRITLVFITSLTLIGLLVPYDEPRLLGGGGANVSPFVIALDKANIHGLNHLINITICISVLSVGLTCVYAGSRILTALAETGYAPRMFTYVDKAGRPLFSVGILLLFSAIAYINVAEKGPVVFSWLVAISGLSTLFTWGSICLCHIRFRQAWKYQGHSVEELPYQAIGGVYGSWIGFGIIVVVLIAQFYIAVWPIDAPPEPSLRAEGFFQAYLAFFIIIGFWVAGYVWKRKKPWKLSEIDLDTGRKSWLTVEDMREYNAKRRAAPLYLRVYRLLFSH